jgi:hypothetical protein
MLGSGGAAKALAFARAQIGKPYVWGATGPDAYDCSGLVMRAWQAGGFPLTRTTYTQLAQGNLQTVGQHQLVIGDLIYPNAGHVQLFSGMGHVVEAARPGVPIREARMSGFMTGRHIPGFAEGGWVNPITLDSVNTVPPGLFIGNNGTGDFEELTNTTKGSRPINIVVNTQEIDPKKHAADLGWELASVVRY